MKIRPPDPLPHVGLLLLCVALAGCRPEVSKEPFAVPSAQTASPTPIAPPSATPSVALSFEEFNWIEASGIHPWRLIGTITNHETFPVEDVSIQLSIPGSGPSGGSTLTASTIPSVIQPSQSGFFQIDFLMDSAPADFTMSYTAVRSTEALPVNLGVDVHAWRESPDGRLLALGEVKNQGDHLLHLMAVNLLLYDDQGQVHGVATSDHLIPALSPNNANPFLASSDVLVEVDSWKAYVEASPALLPSSPPLVFEDKLQREQTSQGQLFFIGQVENQGVTPWGLVVQVMYLLEEEVIGLDTIQLPFPLPPREKIAFVIDPSRSLAPAFLRGAQIEQVEIRLDPDPWKTLPIVQELITLPVAITQFEPIGSRLYLQGEITNDKAGLVVQPAIYVRILDLHGQTRASGWVQSIEALKAGESQGFKLDLLIPGSVDLNLVEFDVRAIGYSVHEE